MKLWIYALIALALFGALGTAKYLYDQNQKIKVELALEKAKKDEAVKEGNRYANRPRSHDDITERVCKWARYVEQQDQGKPKRKLPVRPCP
jgi:hypothetical protein